MKNKTYENSFASLLFPEEEPPSIPSTNPIQEKQPSISINTNKPQPNILSIYQTIQRSQTEANTIKQIPVKAKTTKPSSPSKSKEKNKPISKPKSNASNPKLADIKDNKSKPILHPKVIQNDPILYKLKNFNSIDDLYNILEQNKEDIKKYYAKIDKDNRVLKDKNDKPIQESKGNDTKILNVTLLNRKRGLLPSSVEKTNSNNKSLVKQKQNPIDFARIFNEMKDKNNTNDKKQVKTQDKVTTSKLMASQGKGDIDSKLSIIMNNIKQNSKVIDNKKKQSKPNGLFSKEDFDQDDSFIVNDEDENNEEAQKYLSELSKKFRKGRVNYDDDDGDLEEANFETMQQEERRAAAIADYEDELEEKKELERLKRRKHKMLMND